MKIIRSLFVSVFIFTMVFTEVSFSYDFEESGNPRDTTAGTNITNEAASYYHDLNLNPRDLINGGAYSEYVTSEYGLSYPKSSDDYNQVQIRTRGIPLSQYLVLMNNGNALFTGSVTWELTKSTDAVGWAHEVYMTTSAGGRIAMSSGSEFTVPDNDVATLETIITPSTEAADSPDSSWMNIVFWVNNSNNYPKAGSLETDVFAWLGAPGYLLYHYYNGAASNDPVSPNGIFSYGGNVLGLSLEAEATIETAVLNVTKWATVDSPDTYLYGRHDPVPGALCTTSIIMTNEGSTKAEYFLVIDRIPDNMVGYKVNVQEPEDNVNVTAPSWGGNSVIESPQSWNVYYTTDTEPDRTWDGVGWTSCGDGNITLGTPTEVLDIPSDATFIKFQSNMSNDSGIGEFLSRSENGGSPQWTRITWSATIGTQEVI
jgi:hypothetical protein